MRPCHIAAVPMALLLSIGLAAAGEPAPRWMSPEAGWIDEESETRVESVTEDGNGGYRVELSVPTIDQPIEEVLVIGERVDKPEIVMPEVRVEIINDLDADRSGIILYFGTREKFSLRINYHDGSQRWVPSKLDALEPR